MKTLVSTAILLVGVTQAVAQSSTGTVVVTPSPQQQQGTGATEGRSGHTRSIVMAGNQAQQVSDLEDQAGETVLVVPTPALKPEALAAITEDMTVMCRIFDKAMYPGRRSTGVSIYFDRNNSLGRFWTQAGRTQGLYLDGYGAVFFCQVDFPLVPGSQQKQDEKPEEATDRVWSQTWSELRGQEEPRSGDDEAPVYDAQKVDNLKATVIRTLRHAANLRTRPQDQITIVVTSQTRPLTGKAQEKALKDFYGSRRLSLGLTLTNAGRAGNPLPGAAPTLVLRVGKADVDALAAGQLTADQFASKVQTLWSATETQAPESPSTPSPAAPSR
ncbi:MAG: hypothetical protein JW955_03525 [Sedimentisphaerales bacterium]|nr:hypothetical protein [Sedimentisphaerales bacterium]